MGVSSLLSVVFPDYCVNCGCILHSSEKFLCLFCRANLQETELHLQKHNRIIKQFYGQCDLFCATSLFYFYKNSAVQHLIHELKYKGKQEIGAWLGNWLGEKIKTVEDFQLTDVVIPVPLHKNKLKKRGYNQVALFGKELARILRADYIDDVLVKEKANTTQTKKDLWSRFRDSKDVFSIQNKEQIEGKKILLVDDLITTGATIESCFFQLQKANNVQVGVATMAYSLLRG